MNLPNRTDHNNLSPQDLEQVMSSIVQVEDKLRSIEEDISWITKRAIAQKAVKQGRCEKVRKHQSISERLTKEPLSVVSQDLRRLEQEIQNDEDVSVFVVLHLSPRCVRKLASSQAQSLLDDFAQTEVAKKLVKMAKLLAPTSSSGQTPAPAETIITANVDT